MFWFFLRLAKKVPSGSAAKANPSPKGPENMDDSMGPRPRSSAAIWYDLTVTVDSDPTFRQQLAGHVETGRDSMSDPLLGA